MTKILREIKFRAFDKNLKKMVQNSAYNITMTGVLDMDNKRADHLELMQYTGLKDKNGKEIYEGDILQDKQDYLKGLGLEGHIFEVNENAAGDVMGEMVYGWGFDVEPEYCEVIGNIYSNPELLEKQ